jgi:hypothetical protein
MKRRQFVMISGLVGLGAIAPSGSGRAQQTAGRSSIAFTVPLPSLSCAVVAADTMQDIADRTLIREHMDRYGVVHDSGTPRSTPSQTWRHLDADEANRDQQTPVP